PGGAAAGGSVGAPRGTGSSGPATPAMRKLAEAGRAAAMGMGGYNSQGLCATGVSRAIQNAFGVKVWGNGNQIDNNLPRDKFKQVNMSLEEALKTPGLVLTWEKTSSRLGSIYGHTAITTGDGRSSVSDFIERNTLGAGGRSGLKVFRPIV
ncbi:CHAP domain-containing protein, partial [Corallococcus soli]|uniref:CHAP domain-containing protein n=1 Tax=Corallococcus soli TaxID=2710757 RepID=UPI0039EF4E42